MGRGRDYKQHIMMYSAQLRAPVKIITTTWLWLFSRKTRSTDCSVCAVLFTVS